LWIKQERVVWVVWRLRSISWLTVLFVLFVTLSVLFGSWLFLQPLLSYHWQTTYRKKRGEGWPLIVQLIILGS